MEILWKGTGEGESPVTMRKLCLSKKFPHHEITRNYGILRNESHSEEAIDCSENEVL